MNNKSITRRCTTHRLLLALGCVIGLYFCFLIAWEIHVRTYVFQSTTLSSAINVNGRTTCDIPLTSPGSSVSSYKIAILVMYGESTTGEWGDDLMDMVMKNRYDYAKRHGYDVINANSVIDKTRPVAWSKLLAVKQHLRDYDYIFYIDTDAVFMNPRVRLEELIAIGDDGTSKQPKDFIMTKDWNGPNTGTFFARRSEWTEAFLQLAWDQKHLIPPISPAEGGGKHPFEYEQRAFHYLLNTRVWKARAGLPTYSPDRPPPPAPQKAPVTLTGHGALHQAQKEILSLAQRVGSSREVWQHFSFALPQCAMNSYSLHPLDIKHFKHTARSQVSHQDNNVTTPCIVMLILLPCYVSSFCLI
jgi:hypothetical protein